MRQLHIYIHTHRWKLIKIDPPSILPFSSHLCRFLRDTQGRTAPSLGDDRGQGRSWERSWEGGTTNIIDNIAVRHNHLVCQTILWYGKLNIAGLMIQRSLPHPTGRPKPLPWTPLLSKLKTAGKHVTRWKSKHCGTQSHGNAMLDLHSHPAFPMFQCSPKRWHHPNVVCWSSFLCADPVNFQISAQMCDLPPAPVAFLMSSRKSARPRTWDLQKLKNQR